MPKDFKTHWWEVSDSNRENIKNNKYMVTAKLPVSVTSRQTSLKGIIMSSNNIYTSPICSCIICRKQYSQKGIHSHFHTAHTEEGNRRVRKNGKLGAHIGGQVYARNKKLKSKLAESKYKELPSYCACCGIALEFKKRNNKFCSSSCAAKYNNANRSEDTIAKQRSSLINTLSLKPKQSKQSKKKPEYSKFCYCIICGTTIKHKYTKTCSTTCCSILLSNKAKDRQTHPQNGKVVLYNGIKLGSMYEVAVAKSLDENNILWNRPPPMKYIDSSGKQRNYFPDFYLPDYNVYLDPKNDFLINHINPGTGFKDTDKIEWADKFNNTRTIVLNKNQLSWDIIKSLL